jgi:hypothetical protein
MRQPFEYNFKSNIMFIAGTIKYLTNSLGRMKNTIIYVVLFFISISTTAQSVRFSYESGYGFYSLSNLKTEQLNFSKQINGLPVKAVVHFPDYINHSASIGLYMDKNNIFGFNVSYLTTGGRNHLSDYSGEYKLDMILNGYQVGIESEHIINMENKFDMNLNFKMGLIKSNLDISEYLIIYGLDSNTSTDHYSETNFFLEPNLNVSYHISKGIAVKVGVGYNLNTSSFNGALIDWSGLRARIGISYSL